MFNRRRFLTGAAAAFAAPAFIPGLRAASPNGKLRHASFGASGMALADLESLSASPFFELVAVADVDKSKFDVIKQKWPEAKHYQNWRELLEKEGAGLDTVNISTPDHMHAPIGAACLELGKHVYGQKPLTQNLKECRFVTELARKKGVATQMGIQVSSDFVERYAVDMMRTGAVGKIKAVHTFSDKTWGDMQPVPQKEDPIPAGFDWDAWLGPAEMRPYIDGYYHPGNWRRRRDFGTGTLGDMGCHIFSAWTRGLDLRSPLRVKSTGPVANKDNWAVNGTVEYIFPGNEYTEGAEVSITWYDGEARPPKEVAEMAGGKLPGQGSVIIGTEGVILFGHMSRPLLYPQEKFKTYRYPKLEPKNHWLEFLDAARGAGPKPGANFDYAGPLTESVLLGCLASVFPNTVLEWDGPALKFKNNAEADKLVSRTYRKGWEIPGLV